MSYNRCPICGKSTLAHPPHRCPKSVIERIDREEHRARREQHRASQDERTEGERIEDGFRMIGRDT